MLKKTIVFMFTLCLFLACEKVEEHSDIPEIKLKKFDAQIEETALEPTLFGKLTFSFIDGDGDIGFSENSDTIDDNNIVDVLIKEYNPDGILITDTVGPFYLPYFKESSYKKSLKGDILINIPRREQSIDTAYYEFYIIDRKNHQSNIVTTPIYIYSELLNQ